MDWARVHEFLYGNRCQEMRRYGTCGCRSKGKVKHNPCQRVSDAMQTVLDYQNGLPGSVDELVKLINGKRCSMSKGKQSCNHRRCIEAEEIVNWLQQRKAAA